LTWLPQAAQADAETIRGDISKLGTYTVGLGKQFIVINAYTQYAISNGKDVFEYEAFQKILDTLAETYPHCNFGFPYIGMGLAGGDPTRIIKILEDFAEKIDSTCGTVTLVEFA
jgi:hypothetical protein